MHTPEKKPETLYICPVCKQQGFTLKGLGAHRCKAQGREKLSLQAIQQAVRAAHPIQSVESSGLGVHPYFAAPAPSVASRETILSPAIDTVITAIVAERLRQECLWKDGKIPFTCAHAIHDAGKLAVLVEEVGEVAKEVQMDYLKVEKDEAYSQRLYTELIQVAAVAAAWAEAIAEDLTED